MTRAKAEVRTLNGYRVVYHPGHLTAWNSDNWVGYLYEHVFVMEVHLGRSLKKGEVVHHKNGNRADNTLSNLELTTRGQHTAEHNVTRYGPLPTCYCGNNTKARKARFCSKECAGRFQPRKVVRPTAEELKELLSMGASWCALGRKFGVSDNAVRKWAKSYGLL